MYSYIVLISQDLLFTRTKFRHKISYSLETYEYAKFFLCSEFRLLKHSVLFIAIDTFFFLSFSGVVVTIHSCSCEKRLIEYGVSVKTLISFDSYISEIVILNDDNSILSSDRLRLKPKLRVLSSVFAYRIVLQARENNNIGSRIIIVERLSLFSPF